jgi:mRNA interferase RelE/StbE
MTFSVILSETANATLIKLNKDISNRIIKRLEQIRSDPYVYVKRLHGVELFSLRVGDYRVIMDIKNNKMVIFVITIGHRKAVYEEL